MILPGQILGMLGGGQLGRMFTVAARTMGYPVIVLDPNRASPAGELASEHLCAEYHDEKALQQLAERCAAISTEFENVPATTLAWLNQRCIVRPGANVVAITQDRIHEKMFLREHQFPTVPFVVIRAEQDLEPAWKQTAGQGILKVSRFGYDGKGQARVTTLEGLRAAWIDFKHEPCVLETIVPLTMELSVIIARGADGSMATYPVAENHHVNGILSTTIVPARIDAIVKTSVIDMARRIAERLEYIGVMAVEFFVLPNERVVVNEIAPRPHNSGHYTLDACITNQFEQQVRALCGIPLGDTRLLSPAVMTNLLGDLWDGGRAPSWERILQHPNIKLHLYGKREARRSRKMGHFTTLAGSVEDAVALAYSAKTALGIP